MMLDGWAKRRKAPKIQQAVAEVVLQGLVRTYEYGRRLSTAEMGAGLGWRAAPALGLHAGHLSTTWAWWRRVCGFLLQDPRF